MLSTLYRHRPKGKPCYNAGETPPYLRRDVLPAAQLLRLKERLSTLEEAPRIGDVIALLSRSPK